MLLLPPFFFPLCSRKQICRYHAISLTTSRHSLYTGESPRVFSVAKGKTRPSSTGLEGDWSTQLDLVLAAVNSSLLHMVPIRQCRGPPNDILNFSSLKPFLFFSSHLFSRVGLVGVVLLGSFQAAPDVQGNRAKSKPLLLFVASNLANSFMPVSRHGPFISRQLRMRMKAARGKRWLRPAPRWWKACFRLRRCSRHSHFVSSSPFNSPRQAS